MSAGREIVTLYGSLYRGSRETLSITLGKWGSEVTESHLSNHPSAVNHCVFCARGRRGPLFFAPSCLGLKARFCARQLAGLLPRLKRGQRPFMRIPCRQCVAASLFALTEEAGVHGEKRGWHKNMQFKQSGNPQDDHVAARGSCGPLHSLTQKRQAKLKKKQLKSSVHSLCAFVVAGVSTEFASFEGWKQSRRRFLLRSHTVKKIFDEEEVESSDAHFARVLRSAKNFSFGCFGFFEWVLVIWFVSQECWNFLPFALSLYNSQQEKFLRWRSRRCQVQKPWAVATSLTLKSGM